MTAEILRWGYLGWVVLVLVFVWVSFWRTQVVRWRPAVYSFIGAQFIVWLAFGIRLIYQLQQDSLQQYLLPPESTYVYQQLLLNLRPYVAGWIAAAALFFLGRWLFIHRQKEQMFDRNDLLLAVLAAIVVGWPAIFIFLAILFLASTVGLVVAVGLKKKKLQDRLEVTQLIIPSAIVTVVFSPWLLIWTGLIGIRF